METEAGGVRKRSVKGLIWGKQRSTEELDGRKRAGRGQEGGK